MAGDADQRGPSRARPRHWPRHPPPASPSFLTPASRKHSSPDAVANPRSRPTHLFVRPEHRPDALAAGNLCLRHAAVARIPRARRRFAVVPTDPHRHGRRGHGLRVTRNQNPKPTCQRSRPPETNRDASTYPSVPSGPRQKHVGEQRRRVGRQVEKLRMHAASVAASFFSCDCE